MGEVITALGGGTWKVGATDSARWSLTLPRHHWCCNRVVVEDIPKLSAYCGSTFRRRLVFSEIVEANASPLKSLGCSRCAFTHASEEKGVGYSKGLYSSFSV